MLMASADRWVQLFPETVDLLRDTQPLRATPEAPVFTTTRGTPIEPKTFSAHWYVCLRALGIRQRGLYCTKDTFVTMALHLNAKIAWLPESRTRRYGSIMGGGSRAAMKPSSDGSKRRRRTSSRGEVCPSSEGTGHTGVQSAETPNEKMCEEGDLNQ